MSGRIPKPLQAALSAMVASMGAGGGVYLAEQERTSQLQTEYLRTVAADTSTSDAIKLAMVLRPSRKTSLALPTLTAIAATTRAKLPRGRLWASTSKKSQKRLCWV